MRVAPDTIRVLVCDIDGTLVDSAKMVSPFTRGEVRRVVDQYGISLVLASSRMPRSIVGVFAALDLSGPLLAYNGALALDATTNDIPSLRNERIDGDIAGYLLDVGAHAGVHVGAFETDQWYVNEVDYWALREIRGTGIWPEVADMAALLRDRLGAHRAPHKVMFRGDAASLDAIEGTIAARGLMRITLLRSKPTQIEVVPVGANKLAGLSALLPTLRATMPQVLAFGDAESDRELIAHAGLGIAMGNAARSLADVATARTLSNDEDGVGFMLRYLLPDRSE